jgi:hypothetical protein
MGRQVGTAQRMTPEEQASKLAMWQTETDPRVRQRLISEVVDSIEGLLRALVVERTSSMGARWRQQVFDDLLGDARVIAMESLTSWSPQGGAGVAHWVAGSVRRSLRATDMSHGGGTMPREWRQVSTVAHAIMDESVYEGRILGTTELTERVQQAFQHKTRKSVMEKHPEADQSAVDRLVHDRLSRQSINRALKEVPEILAASSGSVSLDAVQPDGVSLYDQLSEGRPDADELENEFAGVVSQLLQGLPASEIAVLYARYSSGTEPTVTELAETFGIGKPQVKAILRKGAARVVAPHAQWCRLAPGVVSTVDHLPAESRVEDRVRRRVAVAR